MLPSWTNSALCLNLLGIINVMLMCFLILSKGEKSLLLVGPLTSVPLFPFPPIAAHYLPANGHVTECKGSSAPPPFKSVVGFLQVRLISKNCSATVGQVGNPSAFALEEFRINQISPSRIRTARSRPVFVHTSVKIRSISLKRASQKGYPVKYLRFQISSIPLLVKVSKSTYALLTRPPLETPPVMAFRWGVVLSALFSEWTKQMSRNNWLTPVEPNELLTIEDAKVLD
ncbi:hypothetical protein KY290_003278 [Solanum tuberosum]|uniref:Uncharacterized protein n=1 Tax=Solanum tuberosum TaxID=4113 RepID=A0ABQ7WT08_SOLTU|nr:hypothetical protein KY290_003278 [Solanum tuberosum]